MVEKEPLPQKFNLGIKISLYPPTSIAKPLESLNFEKYY
jgi:hypothetical protein